jgi:hypothetical protein
MQQISSFSRLAEAACFAEAASAVSDIGEAVRAAGGRLPATWLEGVLHRLLPPGTPQGAHAPGTADRSLPEPTGSGEIELFAEA